MAVVRGKGREGEVTCLVCLEVVAIRGPQQSECQGSRPADNGCCHGGAIQRTISVGDCWEGGRREQVQSLENLVIAEVSITTKGNYGLSPPDLFWYIVLYICTAGDPICTLVLP